MKGKIKDIISDYFIKSWNLDTEEELDISYVDAKQFLTPQRLDLVCKLIYIDSYINNKNLSYAIEIYTEHIRAFSEGTFIEPGNPEKNSIDKYISIFNKMILTCSKGISHKQSVVPVGVDGNILDGAHRTAIAIYFNLPLPIVRIQNITVNYDYRHFIRYGLKQEYLDFISYNYLFWKDNVYVACIWPIANKKDGGKAADEIICEKAQVFFKKETQLTYGGLINTMIHAYGHQDWTGNAYDGFSGVPNKAKLCYTKGSPSTFYVLSDIDLGTVNDIKQTIRNKYHLSNHSIHITDTKEEAILLAKEILNTNSIDLLNYGCPFRYQSFIKRFICFTEELKKWNCSSDDYLIDSSAVLSLYGLRDCNDIDYITLNKEDSLVKSDMFENHLNYGIEMYYSDSIDSLIYNPTKYLYFLGIKFASLEVTLGMKQKRSEAKDINDIKLIKTIEKKRNNAIFTKENLRKFKKHIRSLAQKNIVLINCYNQLGQFKRLIKRQMR